MTRRKIWPWVLAALLLGGAPATFYGLKARGSKGATLDPTLISTVSRGDLEIAVVELGKIDPREKVAVKSKVAGLVERVLVDEGEKVKKGQLLLSLDSIDFRRDTVRARQEVEKAQAMVELADLTLERRRRALADRGVAAVEVELAENDLKTKRILLAQARESLAGADDKERFSRIASPMDGVIIQRGIRVGETVVPGSMSTFDDKALMTVADLSVLLAKVDLNQIDVAKVRMGQEVTLTLDALPGKSYKAQITKIAPASVLPKGKDVEVFPVEATLASGQKDIDQVKPGMTADVKIHVETRKGVLKLPIEAVTKEKGKSYVTLVKDDPKAKGKSLQDKVEVQVGARNDREQELLGGVDLGARVLIKPPSADQNEFK